MHLEVSELLACPRCGPGQALVVSVDRIEARRVLEGRLACPGCHARYPIRGGTVAFGGDADRPAAEADGASRGEAVAGPDPRGPGPDDAVRVAALLELGEGGGAVLLGSGLEAAAARVAGLAAGVEVLSLAAAGEGAAVGESGVTRLLGVCEEALPLHGGRLRGAALLGGSPAALREAARAVRPGGRVAVLRPAVHVEVLEGLPLRVLAAEASALVAERAAP